MGLTFALTRLLPSRKLAYLMSLGSSLAQARKAAGMSLDDLAARTSIRASVLRDFENDDFSKSGGETYARGHVRNLAAVLGVNPVIYLEQYDAEQSVAKRPMYDLLVENNVTMARVEGSRISIKMLSIISITAIALGLVGQVIYTNVQKRTPVNEQLLIPVPITSISPTPVQSQSSNPTTAMAVAVTIHTSRGTSWIFATDGAGTTLFSGQLPQGATQTLNAPDKVNLRIGNAGAVDVSVNGIAQSSLGAIGEVIDRTFDANSGQ